MTPEESFAAFAAAIHSRVPDRHVADLHERHDSTRRALCGDCGRVVPTKQNLCPQCGGITEDITAVH